MTYTRNLAGLAMLMLAVSGCSHGARGPAHDPAPAHDAALAHARRMLPTALVRSGSVPLYVHGFGEVEGGADSRASLAFRESGEIARVYVAVGQHVRAGEALAQLDARSLAAQEAQARAALAVAAANDAKVRAGARPQRRAQTEAEIDGADRRVALAKAALVREKTLLRLGIASQADVDGASATLSDARTNLLVLEQQRSAEAHPWQPDVAAAGANVAAAQAALAAARARLDAATLRAPFPGVVVARVHNDGESVDPTMPVVEIVSDRAPIFTAQVAPRDAALVRAGDGASVRQPGTPLRVPGAVLTVVPSQLSAARTVPVLIRLQTATIAFAAGAGGTASIRVGSGHGLVVPASAVVADPTTGAAQVFVERGKAYVPESVRVRERFDGDAWVTSSTLRPGDAVVTRDAYDLVAPGSNGATSGDDD